MAKLRKLRENPRRFCEDSPYAVMRGAGRALGPLFDNVFFRSLLIDPRGTLAASDLPLLSARARRLEERAARHRRAAVAAAGQPLVSIIMAAHDAADTIESAVDSLRAQTYPHWELIIVDDASSDDTRAISRMLAASDPRIIAAGHDDNRGAARTRNVGLGLATGEFVTFNDSDDRAHPERLERQLEPLVRDHGLMMSLCHYQREDEDGRLVSINDRMRGKAIISMMFRREPVLERLGYFRPMPVSEDAEYYERIVAVFGADAAVTLRETLLFQRFSPDSLLFSDGETQVCGDRVIHRRSTAAEEALGEMRENIERIRVGALDPYVAMRYGAAPMASGPLILVAGARPNFMKIAPILRELESRDPPIETLLVHTGQHYDAVMSDVFFDQLGIRKPDAHLQVGSATHGAQTGRLMIAFEEYIAGLAEKPRAVVVVGDVNSTMACALVAVKMHIGCAHVEAGLRSGDRHMPEEINRVVTDAIADLLLVSEPDGLVNLRAEGVAEDKVRYVGNVMIDTLVNQLEDARAARVPEREGLERGSYAHVTLHRPSNVDGRERLTALVEFLSRVATRAPVIFPVHPRTAAKLDEYGLRDRLESADGVHLRDPLGYRENLGLMEAAKLVISDSGGIQEETTYLGVPCVTLRPSTERPVTESVGTNTVVGEDLDRAWQAVSAILAGSYKTGGAVDGWDGRAAVRIVDELERAFPGA